MAYADPALLKLAGLAGVTGANRAAQVVLGSDPEGGFHGRPRATAKTRSDLLKERKWTTVAMGIKGQGLNWFESGGRPGPGKANSPRTLASKNRLERDDFLKKTGATRAARVKTYTRSQIADRRKKEMLESGKKFQPTKEQSVHAVNLPVKYEKLADEKVGWWQRQDHLVGYASGTAFWGPDDGTGGLDATIVDGSYTNPWARKERRRQARGTGGNPAFPAGPIPPARIVDDPTGIANHGDVEVPHDEEAMLATVASAPTLAGKLARRTKPLRRPEVRSGLRREDSDLGPDPLKQRTITRDELAQRAERRRGVKDKVTHVQHSLSPLMHHTTNRWTVKVLDYEHQINPRELRPQNLDENGKSLLWDPEEHQPMWTQFLNGRSYLLTSKWVSKEEQRAKSSGPGAPLVAKSTSLTKRLRGSTFGSSIALPADEAETEGDPIAIKPGSAAAGISNKLGDSRSKAARVRTPAMRARAPQARPESVPVGVGRPRESEVAENRRSTARMPRKNMTGAQSAPTLTADGGGVPPIDVVAAEEHRGRPYTPSPTSSKGGRSSNVNVGRSIATGPASSLRSRRSADGQDTHGPNRSLQLPEGFYRPDAQPFVLHPTHGKEHYPDVSALVHSADPPLSAGPAPVPVPRPGANVPGMAPDEQRPRSVATPDPADLRSAAGLGQSSSRVRPGTVSGGARAISRAGSARRRRAGVIRTGGL